jgi:hypothetical protein
MPTKVQRSLRDTVLPADGQRMRLYQGLLDLAEGESIIAWSPDQGEVGKKWCYGLQAWVNWERKRRLRAAQIGTEILTDAQMRAVDATVGISRRLVCDKSNRWGLCFSRQRPFEIEFLSSSEVPPDEHAP